MKRTRKPHTPRGPRTNVMNITAIDSWIGLTFFPLCCVGFGQVDSVF